MERMAQSWPNPQRCHAAAQELEHRLKRTGLKLPPRTRSRADKWPRRRAVPVLKRDTTRTEILIVRALARTSSAAQFLCTPDGDVYTADTDGWALPTGRRDYLTGLSELLDDAAKIFNDWRREGRGGRFYERDGYFFDADDGAIFLEIEISQDNGDYSDWDDYADTHAESEWAEYTDTHAGSEWAYLDSEETYTDSGQNQPTSEDVHESSASSPPPPPGRNFLQKLIDWIRS